MENKPHINYGLRESVYTALAPALAERFSEHLRDILNAPKNYITKKLVNYLTMRGKSSELENIKIRLNISSFQDNHERPSPYEKLSLDRKFQILILKTFGEDSFEFKKIVNVQGFAREMANAIERIL